MSNYKISLIKIIFIALSFFLLAILINTTIACINNSHWLVLYKNHFYISFLIQSFIQVLLYLGLVFLWLKNTKMNFEEIGFRIPKIKSLIIWSVVTLVLSFAYEILNLHYGKFSFKPIDDYLKLIYYTSIYILPLSLIEEIIFRGLIYTLFEKRFGALIAVVSQAILFTMIHWQRYSLLGTLLLLFFAGLIYGLGRLKTKSIIPGMIAHSANNIFSTIVR